MIQPVVGYIECTVECNASRRPGSAAQHYSDTSQSAETILQPQTDLRLSALHLQPIGNVTTRGKLAVHSQALSKDESRQGTGRLITLIGKAIRWQLDGNRMATRLMRSLME